MEIASVTISTTVNQYNITTSTGNGSGTGAPGKDFKYSDFTAEQLAALKGPAGKDFKYTDFTTEQLALLKGQNFKYTDFTPEQLAALKGEDGEPFTYEDFTAQQLAALKGEKGDNSPYEAGHALSGATTDIVSGLVPIEPLITSAFTLTNIWLTVRTAPEIIGISVDVMKNEIFLTTITIAAGAKIGTVTNNTNFAIGDRLTFNITQTGIGETGKSLEIYYKGTRI